MKYPKPPLKTKSVDRGIHMSVTITDDLVKASHSLTTYFERLIKELKNAKIIEI